MAKKTSAFKISHIDIVNAAKKRNFAPVYLLMGEESYYIDKLTEYLADTILPEAERDFNQTVTYCTKDTDAKDIINAARRYPMMSEYQVVIVKEAQNLENIEELQLYVKKPMPTTILVICYKHGTPDLRKAYVKMIQENGVVYCSNRLDEHDLPSFIENYLKRKRVGIDRNAQMMMAENIGSDLSRLASELDKLVITMPAGQNIITPELVEKNIGISKDFNIWEFKSAIVNKDVYKANLILNYFNSNPKIQQPIATIAILFSYFAALMQAHYAPDKTDRGLMAQLELKSPYGLRDYQLGMRNYNARKTMDIISMLRESDTKLKGIKKGGTTDADVMRELLYFILH